MQKQKQIPLSTLRHDVDCLQVVGAPATSTVTWGNWQDSVPDSPGYGTRNQVSALQRALRAQLGAHHLRVHVDMEHTPGKNANAPKWFL